MSPLVDTLDRPLANLRLSVTDRCNLRCEYCMPETDYAWLPREDILHFEELDRLVDVFLQLGVTKVRLTGGEPLLRKDLQTLVERLAVKSGLKDLALTTNAVLLPGLAKGLKQAGLHRLTVSLDSLDRERFIRLTRYDELPRVLAGIEAAAEWFPGFKIDTVVLRGVNDDELVALMEFARANSAELRFIEYMDVGGATRWSWEQVVTREEILGVLTAQYGAVSAIDEVSSAPADRFRLSDGTVFGIISSTTAPFCRQCDRSRLTADGMWYLCLYATKGIDLRGLLRGGASNEEIAARVSEAWTARTDRGAEHRLALHDRSPMIPLSSLKRDPHLEMHTRGG
ncbi:MAG: GTP 3',8-cyclase MoaA [Acidobacteriota bacterium]